MTQHRIAGIDPGTRIVGYCILETRRKRLSALTAGTIRPSGRSLPDRLGGIFGRLDAIFQKYRPAEVVLERAFVGRNPQTALTIGMARGVVMLCAARCGARVIEVTPGEAKRAVAAGGQAAKEQVQRMVQLILGLAEPLPPDASDAVALALSQGLR